MRKYLVVAIMVSVIVDMIENGEPFDFEGYEKLKTNHRLK